MKHILLTQGPGPLVKRCETGYSYDICTVYRIRRCIVINDAEHAP